MLRSSGPAARPDIQRCIDALLKEDVNFDRTENRTAIRENLVRAAEIQIRDPEQTFDAFSRNVSATGIGLITKDEVAERTVATIKIFGLDGKETSILSECRWCKKYGDKWYLTGWQFISLKR